VNKAILSRKIAAYLQLTKPIISVSVAISALTGFLIRQGFFASGWLECVVGVFLLSAGASAINHLQEAGTDLIMRRTGLRPIPAKIIQPGEAIIFSILLLAGGFILLFQPGNWIPLILGLLNVLWYNAIYTPLKKVTAFAAIPGAVVGAVPPMIGWTAAGGELFHPHIIIVAFLFFVGQIPHFWLILLKNAGDYEAAGFPTLTKIFSQRQIVNLTLAWIFATAMAAVLMVVFGIFQLFIISAIVLVTTLVFVILFYLWMSKNNHLNSKKAFIALNVFYMLMMAALIADALLR
jgi:protoheme IX farnesyltransferase